MHRYRSHTCGALRAEHIGATVRLSGWCHRIRDHGGVLFIDLRDHYGVTQIVADPDSPAFKTAEKLRSEWVVKVDGLVRRRPGSTENPDLPTGAVEVFASDIEVLGPAGELPMPVFGDQEYPEEVRLKYRFLDLRRERLHANIIKRGAIIDSLRRRMKERGFFEFQTPILTASSPEGARDFLVPSRLHPGKFYALPQAPQQFKQLVMISGFDRYFQIAPCFRDEDARADRSPGEFYQLDIEMSFVTQEDVFDAVEPVLRGVFEEFAAGKSVTKRFPLIPFDNAIRQYGSDKPDLRNPIKMQEINSHFSGSDFRVFASRIATDPAFEVWAIPAPTGGNRAFCDRMDSWAKGEGQPGLAYIFWRRRSEGLSSVDLKLLSKAIQKAAEQGNLLEAENLRSKWFDQIEAAGPVARNLGPKRTEDLRLQLSRGESEPLGEGDAVFFVGGSIKDVNHARFAGLARTKVGNDLGLVDKDRFEFCWIVDFPMYGWDEEEKRFDFSHNPFSMPNMPIEEFLALQSSDTEKILGLRAFQYDIVCNGIELSSGAIRNHRPDVMKKAFAIAGYNENVLEQKFGGMLRALSLGAPPHGGIAPGVDRIVMLLCGEENLREVVLFPMNQRAEDLLMGAPSEVTPKQLRELHIRLARPVPRTPTLRERADVLVRDGEERFRKSFLERNLPPDEKLLVEAGSWSIALAIDPLHAERVSDQGFLTTLESSNPNYTGWPIWLDSRTFTDQAHRPQIKDKAWEALIISDRGWSKHLDFSRLDPKGEFYLWRALQDDLTDKIRPGTALDPILVLIRVAEAISVGLAFAKALGWKEKGTRLGFAFRWTKLSKRELVSWANPFVPIRPGHKAHDNEITTFTELSLDTPASAIAPFVDQATQDLFALFNGYKMPSVAVEEWVRQLVERRLNSL